MTERLGSRNYNAAWITAIVAVIGSIAAAILTALGESAAPRWATAIIAALPAAVIAVNTTFRFEQRGIWHYRTTKRFEGLVRKLRYEKADVADVSKEFSQIDLETFDGWIDYSNLSGQRNRDQDRPGAGQDGQRADNVNALDDDGTLRTDNVPAN
jgi:hypothetical protein